MHMTSATFLSGRSDVQEPDFIRDQFPMHYLVAILHKSRDIGRPPKILMEFGIIADLWS